MAAVATRGGDLRWRLALATLAVDEMIRVPTEEPRIDAMEAEIALGVFGLQPEIDRSRTALHRRAMRLRNATSRTDSTWVGAASSAATETSAASSSG